MELYVRPQFFNQVNNIPGLKEPQIDVTNQNIYTEFHKYTNSPIVSKFKEIRFIPLSGGELDYESDRWDFSQYNIVTNDHSALVFKSCAELFKDALKDYILLRIMNGNIKASTLVTEFMGIRHFLNYLAGTGLYAVEGVEDSDVEKYLISLNLAERTFIRRQMLIKRFLEYYDAEHGTELLTPGIQELCKPIDSVKLNAVIRAGRRKAIPIDYFNKLLSGLIRVMHDENESPRDRGMAAMLVIDSQTGLRASELSLLEANTVEEVDIEGKIAKMIKYKIVKVAKGNTEGFVDAITYINDISYDAYKVALEVFSEGRTKRKVNYLCCPNTQATLPITPIVYITYLKKFCVTHYEELGCLNEELKNTLCGSITKHSFLVKFGNYYSPNKNAMHDLVSSFSDDQEFYYPLVHQFRNTVVSGLLAHGIQLEFVRRYMGHLTEETTAGYAESYDTDMQENLAVSESILNTIVSGDAKLLGPSADRLMTNINAWIDSHQLNVATDMEEIIEGLEKVVPIRAKRGGVCIKGSKLTNACSVDVQTDEFMCAVGLCSNICHFYFNADESYADYKEAMATYTFNKENGFARQAEKEYTKVTYILRNRLGPEMVELVKEINQIGAQEVLKRHPNLEEVLNNIEEIKEAIDGYTEEELS